MPSADAIFFKDYKSEIDKIIEVMRKILVRGTCTPTPFRLQPWLRIHKALVKN